MAMFAKLLDSEITSVAISKAPELILSFDNSLQLVLPEHQDYVESFILRSEDNGFLVIRPGDLSSD